MAKPVKRTAKYNYTEVRAFFAENGCILLSSEYLNNLQPLDYVCTCGRISKASFSSFRVGHRCKKCGSKKLAGERKYSYAFVSNYFSSQKCALLSAEYINCKTLLEYICSCGARAWITFDRFKRGGRCMECANKRIGEKNSGSKGGAWDVDRDAVRLRALIRRKAKNLLHNTLRVIGTAKEQSTKDSLGYSPLDLLDHIVNHANWSSVRGQSWHLDHIFPVRAFVDYGIVDLKLINRLDNLQPLLARDNLSKGDRYNRREFERWISNG
jgi:hypothetical protein